MALYGYAPKTHSPEAFKYCPLYPLGEDPALATVNEYRQFTNECLRWAIEAETEDDRKAFLELARYWTLAALRLEGLLAPPDPKQTRFASNRELGTRFGVMSAEE